MTKDVQFESRRVSALDDGQRRWWDAMRAKNAAFQSPLLALSLMELVDEIRGGVEMAIASRAGEPVGMFPFFRDRATATPFAGTLTDLQAVVTSELSLPFQQWLRAVGLSRFRFHAYVTDDSPSLGMCCRSTSPFIDISQGFEAYREERRQAKSHELKESLRKGRKVRREIGDMELDTACQDANVLEQVLQWKSAQLEARSLYDSLSTEWVRDLLHRCVTLDRPDCQGMQCALRVNGELIAGALGIRSGAVFHGWVMAFTPDPAFRKFSPGILMLTELLQQCESLGIERIDMGSGDESFKRSFASGGFPIGEGSFGGLPGHSAMWCAMLNLRDWLGSTSLRKSLQKWLGRRRDVRQLRGGGP